MFRRHLTYANVVATTALVFAMSGGALAATHYLITSPKQIKPSVLSALKGKPGPSGPAGANGTNGSAGEKGPSGEKGPQGNPGTAGTNGTGTNGESVTVAKLAKKEDGCNEGGAKFSNKTGEATACNGEPAAGGGYPETLPAGKTETGTWAYGGPGEGHQHLPISFTIPLEKGIEAGHVEFVEEGSAGGANCDGGEVEDPKAKAGYLCIYTGSDSAFQADGGIFTEVTQVGNVLTEGTNTAGGVLLIAEEQATYGSGTWAVTEK